LSRDVAFQTGYRQVTGRLQAEFWKSALTIWQPLVQFFPDELIVFPPEKVAVGKLQLFYQKGFGSVNSRVFQEW